MTRAGWTLFAALAAVACGPSTPNRPAQGSASGTSGAASSGSAVSGASGSGSGAGAAATTGDSTADASNSLDAGGDTQGASEAGAEDAGAGDEGQAEASDDGTMPTPPLCNPNIVWSDGTALAISTGADQFGAVTPDERTLVWTSTALGGIATIYCADRTDPATPFVSPAALVLTGIDVTPGPMAISPDGLRLALEASDTSFFTLTRPDRNSPFGLTVDTTEFAELNGEIAASEAVVKLGDPVYGADGQTFVYSRFPAGGAQGITTIFDATRAGTDPWSDGTPLNGDPIQETNDEVRRRPSGIAADALTLFYWDDAAASEMMAWRTTTDGAFANPTAIGARTGAQPNAACTALYYSAATDGGTGLFVATPP